jgi:hypothetical protein
LETGHKQLLTTPEPDFTLMGVNQSFTFSPDERIGSWKHALAGHHPVAFLPHVVAGRQEHAVKGDVGNL